jgi:hypothetical protein
MVNDHGQLAGFTFAGFTFALLSHCGYNRQRMLNGILATASDGLKLLLLLVCGGGLVALGRWSSRLGGPGSDSPLNEPTPDAKQLLPDTPSTRVWPPSAEEVAASLPYDPLLGKIRITKFFFKKTDAITGPADPEVFADELQVELYDPDSGHHWWQSYFVATPRGLDSILRQKSWRYLHAPQMLVISRYDLEEIRRAVVSRIMADHEYFKGREDVEQSQEESL